MEEKNEVSKSVLKLSMKKVEERYTIDVSKCVDDAYISGSKFHRCYDCPALFPISSRCMGCASLCPYAFIMPIK